MNWLEIIKLAFTALTFLLSLTSLIVAALIRRDSAAKAALRTVQLELASRIDVNQTRQDSQLAGMTTRFDGLSLQVSQMAEAIKHVPTHHDMTALREAMTSLSNVVAELKGSQDANTRMVERMNQYLMERGT